MAWARYNDGVDTAVSRLAPREEPPNFRDEAVPRNDPTALDLSSGDDVEEELEEYRYFRHRSGSWETEAHKEVKWRKCKVSRPEPPGKGDKARGSQSGPRGAGTGGGGGRNPPPRDGPEFGSGSYSGGGWQGDNDRSYRGDSRDFYFGVLGVIVIALIAVLKLV